MSVAERRSEDSGLFDRMARAVSDFASKAPFFFGCCLMVVIWLIQGAIVVSAKGFSQFLDPTYQLEINSTTTIITFLLVALFQNTAMRENKAVTHKLDASLEALADVLDNTDGVDEAGDLAQELRRMAGVEMEASK